jgi:small redox-active disulfide protein 2
MSMKLQILGTGCSRCKQLTEHTERAAQELGLDYEVEKVTDFDRILEFGIVATPALVVDGSVKIFGQVPTTARIKEILAGAGAIQP